MISSVDYGLPQLKTAPTRGLLPLCAAAAAVTLVGLGARLFADDFLRGLDAYYYAVQADSLVRTGQLRIPDSGLVHYPIAALHFCGLSAESSVRAWTVCSLGLFYGVLLFTLRTCRSRGLALALFAWAVASPTIGFIAIEFPKQFSFLIAFTAWFLVLEARPFRPLALAALVPVSFLLHKSAVVYAGIIACAYGARAVFAKVRGRMPGRLPLLPTAIGLALCGLAVWFAVDAPHVKDLLRLRGANLTPGIIALLREKNLPSAIALECLLSLAVFGMAAFARRRDKARLVLPVFLMLSTAIPAFGEEPFNFGERFAVLCPLLALLGCFLLHKDAEPRFAPGGAAAGILLAVAAVCGALRPAMLYPEGSDAGPRAYARMTQALAPKEIPMLILHRGMHFSYKYQTGRDAFSYEPEAHWDKTRVWRLAWGVSDDEWQALLPVECGWSTGLIEKMPAPGYALVREDCWDALRGRVEREVNPELYDLLWNNPMNPSAPRPAFLYKKHEGEEGEGEFPASPPQTARDTP